MKIKFVLIVVLLFLSIISIASATSENQDSITLLAVSQLDNGSYVGGLATMHLQIKPGTGAIFIESYPASKIDTQVATRLANEIACEFSTQDCSEYDFFYTIRADSPIVGGPSGGGATAVLTLAVLEDLKIREDVAMTGAISSGGIIGPVAGIKEKVQAAQDYGKHIAIIPELAIKNKTEELNLSFNISEILNQSFEDKPFTYDLIDTFEVDVKPVVTLYGALNYATLENVRPEKKEFFVPKQYSEKMRDVGSQLCTRSEELNAQVKPEKYNSTYYIQAQEFLNRSKNVSEGSYYTKASFCFSANLQLRQLLLENVSQDVLLENYNRLNVSWNEFSQSVDQQPLNTLADLEAYVVVTERLLEAKSYMDLINKSNVSSSLLGLAIERYASAVAWSEFFGLEGSQELDINQASIQNACIQEIQKVESRLNYLRLLLPESFLSGVVEDLDISYNYQREGSYARCLFKATKTKAYANLFLSSMLVDEDKIPELIEAKRDRTRTVLAENKDRFAILGYSYYEYAESFIDEDPYSGLIFAEYGLAFSDVSGYFPPRTHFVQFSRDNLDKFVIFVVGFFLGATSIVFIAYVKQRKRLKKRKKR